MKRLIFLGLMLFILGNIHAQESPGFSISPNPVCIGEPVTIVNQAPGYSSYYWSFCAASPFDLPSVDALSFTPNPFNQPVFIALAQQDEDYYAFIVNHNLPHPGYITRISFGSDILNPNPDVDNINGMLPAISEGIQIVEENGNWYAFVVGGKTDPDGNNTAFFRRLDFGNSLSNTPDYFELNTEDKLFFPHDLYIFKDEGTNDWWGMTVNNGLSSDPDVLDGSVTRFAFGGNIENMPQVQNLGHFNRFKDPVGIFPIKEENKWYVFVTDRHTGLVRLDFGNSLTNTPIATTVSTGGVLTRPRDISLLRYCDQIVGFVVDGEQHNNSHLVRLDFADGLESSPSAEQLTELGSYFSFPHSISDLIRADDQTFALVTNVGLNNIARVFFPSCEDEIPAQYYETFTNPEPVVYYSPGTYNIELIVNIGEPDQANVCHEIIVNLPTAEFELVNDTICSGNQALIRVHFTGFPPWDFSYTNGVQTSNFEGITSNPYSLYVSPEVTTTYTITSIEDNLCGGEAAGSPVKVNVIPKDDAGFTYSSGTFCKNSDPVFPTVNLEGGVFSAGPPGLVIDPVTGEIIPGESNEGTYYVTYSVSDVCPNSLTLQVNIYDEVLAHFYYAQPGFCPNAANPLPLYHPNSYPGEFSSWPEGLSVNPMNGEIILHNSEPGTYWIKNEIPEEAGCPYEVDSTLVIIYHLPFPAFTSDTVCLGDSTSLFDLSVIAEGEIVERIWYYNDVEIGRGFETQFAFPEPPGLHNITLEVVSNNGCITDTVMTAFVKALPEIDLISNIPAHQILDTVISVCLFESITLDASNPDNPDNIAYLWATGDTTATLTVGAYGIGYEMQYHYVTVIDNVTGCTDTKGIYVEFSIAACVGIGDFNPLKGITLFPNPAYDIVQLQSVESIKDLWLGIYNVHGALIENYYLPELSSNMPFNISVSELPQGLYVLILRNNDVVSSVKMMIAR
jgi:hypothetical protein